MKYTKETFLNELKKRFPNEDIEILEFSGTFKPIEYKCNKCGKIYSKTRANHLYENKYLCTNHVELRDSAIRDWILDFLDTNGQFILAQPWSGFTNDDLFLYCKKCNSNFKKQSSNLYKRNIDSICPICGHNGSKKDINYFLNLIPEKVKKDFIFTDFVDISHSVKIKHKCGFTFKQLPSNFLKNCNCPKCTKKISLGEQKIIEILNKRNISFKYQKSFSEISTLHYDFFLPDFNCLIEYQGEQHYFPVGKFGGEQRFIKQQEFDKKKRDYAIEKGYRLLCLPYTVQRDMEIILSSFLGSTTSLIDVAPSGAKEKILQLCNNNIV